MNNNFSYTPFEVNGFYTSNLNFNDTMISNIINDMYDMENHPDNIYSSDSRTFRLTKGFHSCSLFEKGILEKYENLKILVSRVQELLYNYFCVKNNIDFTVAPHILRINEIWFNILRTGDFNVIHNHPDSHISGNFYLKVPTKKKDEIEGSLQFCKTDNHNFYLPLKIRDERNGLLIIPHVNLGTIFQSHLKHIVYPHFSDEDRIGIAFNARIDYTYHYDKIYPIPYWCPIYYSLQVDKSIIDDERIKISFKNGQTFYIQPEQPLETLLDKRINIDKNILKGIIGSYTINRSKYFICDDYFETHQKPWNDDAHYYYEDNNSDKLVIIFSGMGGDGKPPTFIFYNFLKNYKCDKLFLRDLDYSWFLNNSNFGKNPLETATFIKSFIKERNENVYTLGCSAGGYAAILYSRLLKVDMCLTFSPQTVLKEDVKKSFEDGRWEDNLSNLRKNVDDKYLDLAKFTPFSNKTYIFLSHELDLKHANHIKHDNCIIKIININDNTFNKHLTALFMKNNNNMLKNVLDQILEPVS